MNFFSKLKLIMSSFWSFIEPFVLSLLKGAGSIALQLAMKYIPLVAGEMGGSSGPEKRDEVVRRIKEEAITLGITLTLTEILNAIQAAYSKLKAEDQLPK
jgi:hypothetical protein